VPFIHCSQTLLPCRECHPSSQQHDPKNNRCSFFLFLQQQQGHALRKRMKNVWSIQRSTEFGCSESGE
jgi:hypothetical protein